MMEFQSIARTNMDLGKLKEPFPAEDIEWRVQQAGARNGRPWAMVLAYVTARAIQDRLDNVCGPENWKNEFCKGPEGGVMCGISIRVGDEWITKWDGAENTQVEAVKGGYSASTKRAAVQWGIGRYLYDLDATFANISPNGKNFQPAKAGKYEAFKWDPPALPSWALPKDTATPKTTPPKAPSAPRQPVKLATPAQVQKIQILAGELGLNDRDAKIARVNQWLHSRGSSPVESTKELTMSDASLLIEAMAAKVKEPAK